MPEQQNLFQDTISEEYAKYLVYSRQEIMQILRELIQHNELVTAYFNQGKEFFLTSGTDAETNRRALISGKIILVSSQNRIKIQFSTPALELINVAGRPAFRAPLPISVLKLQRREYYRLVAPIRVPLLCIVPKLAGGFEAMVADISVGGVGISGFPNEVALEIGEVFADCQIALPEHGTVVSSLEVRNMQHITLRSGLSVVRAGCGFVGIPAPHQAMIQRYIIRIDRERRALLKGA
jgi:c-di-GMP-binding flagellar brake protein YcgR